jgi:hypothetical protein
VKSHACLERFQISLRIGHEVLPPDTGGDRLGETLAAYNDAAAVDGLPDELNPTLLAMEKVEAFLEGLCGLPGETVAVLQGRILYLNAPGLPLSPADPVRPESLRAGWPLDFPAGETGQLAQPSIQARPDLAQARAQVRQARAATKTYDEEAGTLAARLASMDEDDPAYWQALRDLSTLKSKRFYAASVWQTNSRTLSLARPEDEELAADLAQAEEALQAYVAPPQSGMPGGMPG